ncbi:choice-of-anchor G family protein [Microbacterium sp. NIBRBAC000506063]|uniref:choice-of-anchor G family protein n=1 Tax=Microbacterium sp. NIBRBAC000506063 TaxID=2734618 RepID=UPI001BB4F072|nr:choice-of-anchor G family protein [Microbacterium sp. NIBRBAC000506063]QTV80241.1 choice-of-anchor G family protein [Microbacterium sp. NIBRBAC000506063]
MWVTEFDCWWRHRPTRGRSQYVHCIEGAKYMIDHKKEHAVKKKSRRTRPFTVAAIAALVVGHSLGSSAAFAAPGDESASSARFLSGSLLLDGVSLDNVAALAGVETSHDGTSPDPDTQTSSLDLTALNALNITIPGGLSVPLGDFLALGAVNQYSQSSDGGQSRAATGAVNDSGIVDTSGTGDYPADATLDLSGLLGESVTDVVADLEISLRAVTAEASLDGEDGVTRDYHVAGGDLLLSLPAVGGLETVLTGTDGVADTVDAAINTLTGPNGLLAGVIATLTGVTDLLGNSEVEISITSNVAGALDSILDTPLGDGVITLDLRTGVVEVDLDALFSDTTGRGLNNLLVGEEVLSADVLNNLLTRIGNLLDTVPDAVESAVEDALNAATLNVDIDVCLAEIVICTLGATVSVPNQTLASVVDGTATASISAVVAGVTVPGLDGECCSVSLPARLPTSFWALVAWSMTSYRSSPVPSPTSSTTSPRL